MRNLQRFLAPVVAILLTAAFAACSANPTITGNWAMTEIVADGESYSGDALEEIGRAGEMLELTEDGDVTWDATDTMESGTYDYDPETGSLGLAVTNQDGQNAEYEMVVDEITSDSLTISIPDFVTYTFERQ